MQTFSLPDNYAIECRAERTRYGFRHLAELTLNGAIAEKDKACYYNRTWERFEFQTVAHGVIRKHFDEATANAYNQIVDQQGIGHVEQSFRTIGTIAKLGELFCDKPEEQNRWKRRMLEAGLAGLDFPEGFDDLPEEEKERRLNEVINLTLKP